LTISFQFTLREGSGLGARQERIIEEKQDKLKQHKEEGEDGHSLLVRGNFGKVRPWRPKERGGGKGSQEGGKREREIR